MQTFAQAMAPYLAANLLTIAVVALYIFREKTENDEHRQLANIGASLFLCIIFVFLLYGIMDWK